MCNSYAQYDILCGGLIKIYFFFGRFCTYIFTETYFKLSFVVKYIHIFHITSDLFALSVYDILTSLSIKLHNFERLEYVKYLCYFRSQNIVGFIWQVYHHFLNLIKRVDINQYPLLTIL